MTTPRHGGNVFAAARRLGGSPEDLLDFSANINPLGPPAVFRKMVEDGFDLVRHYPDPDYPELKQALAGYHGVPASQIVPGNGSTQLIYAAVRMVRPGRAMIAAPAFSEYARALNAWGIEPEYRFTSEQDGFLLQSVPDVQGLDLVFLANPASPAGGVVPSAQIAEMIEEMTASGAFVVLDETFVDFVEEESIKSLVGRLPGLLVLRSFTKFFALPGLRLGYALAAEKTAQRLEAQIEPWSVGVWAQAAGPLCLQDADYQRRTRLLTAEAREDLAEALDALPGLETMPSRVNYLLVKITRPNLTAADVGERLAREKILIRDASNFAGLDERSFRTAVRLEEENRRLVEALGRVLRS